MTKHTNAAGSIKCRKAEIEKLKAENRILSRNADTAFQDGLDERRELFELEIKAEAYKEFAEKLKKRKGLFHNLGLSKAGDYYAVAVEVSTIDDLLKEMVGEENERQGQHSYVSDRADEK